MQPQRPELRVEIRKLGNRYFAITKQSNGRELCTNEFQHDPTGLTHLGPLWLVERGKLSDGEARRLGMGLGHRGKTTEAQVALYGWRLYNYLFGSDKSLREHLQQFARSQQPEAGPVHLTLSLTPDAASLWRLPWEYLYDGKEFLCLNGNVLLSRQPEGLREQAPAPGSPPLRVLVIIAGPGDQAPLDMERELAVMQDALDEVAAAGQIAMTLLPEANVPALQEALRTNAYHVLHYIGHGNYSLKQHSGFLCLENAFGETELLGAAQLHKILGPQHLHLLVLSACQSAQIGVLDAFDSIATRVLQRTVPAVLSIPTSLQDESAITLARALYTSLAGGVSIAESVNAARWALKGVDEAAAANQQRFDWGVPGLYQRVPEITPLAEAATPDASEDESSQAEIADADIAELPRPSGVEAAAEVPPPADPDVSETGGNAEVGAGFVGRRTELQTLRRVLHDETPIFYLWGSAGVGKSTLVQRFLDSPGFEVQDTLVISCAHYLEPLTLLGVLADFWRKHETPLHQQAADLLLESGERPFERAKAAQKLLDRFPDVIVFDDIDAWFDLSHTGSRIAQAGRVANHSLRQILLGLVGGASPSRSQTRFIFTGERRWADLEQLPREHRREMQLPLLPQRQAIQLMSKLPHLASLGLEGQQKVYWYIGGHPQALHLLDAWLEVGHSLDDMLNTPLQDVRSPVAWAEYLLNDLVEQLDPGEYEVLTAAVVLVGDFSAEVISRLTPVTAWHAAPLLQRWQRRGLIQVEPGGGDATEPRYVFPALVRQHLLQRLSREELQALHEQAAAYYGALFLDEARRQAVSRNLTNWSEERIAWLARDVNGVLGTWLRQERDSEATRRLRERALAWQHHLFHAEEFEAAVQITRALVPILNQQGLRDLATALLQRALDTTESGALASGAPAAGAPVTSARMEEMDELAQLRLESGHLKAALQVYQEASQALDAAQAPLQKARVLARIASVYRRLGELSQAARKYEEALQLLRQQGEQAEQAEYLLQLAQIYRANEGARQALVSSQAARELYEQFSNQQGIAAATHEQGLILKAMGRLDDALEHFADSLSICRKIHSDLCAAQNLEQIGLLLSQIGRLAMAVKALEEARALYESLGAGEAQHLASKLASLSAKLSDQQMSGTTPDDT